MNRKVRTSRRRFKLQRLLGRRSRLSRLPRYRPYQPLGGSLLPRSSGAWQFPLGVDLRTRRSKRLVALLTTMAVAFAGVVALVALRGGDSKRERPVMQPASTNGGPFAFTVLPGWRAIERFEPVPGMPFEHPLVFEEQVSKMRLIAGLLPATSPTLLPAEFVKQLRAPPDRPLRVRLDQGVLAYYYPRLEPADASGALDVYVVPTTSGIATMACTADKGVISTYDDCWRTVASVALRKVSSLRLGPDAAFRQRLPGAIAMVDAARDRAREPLATRIPGQQAKGAADVGLGYEAAAASLAPLVPASPAEPKAAVQALADAGAAYHSVAEALQRGDPAAFERGRDVVHAREHELKALLRRLEVPPG
jgi:hypothetical protein